MRTTILSVLLALVACSGEPANCQPLKSGDRVVFMGDSITQQRIYTRYVMNYFTLRYPGANISFRNAGWNADTATNGLARLQRDVLPLKPTVVAICYGVNDAYPSRAEFDAGKTQFDPAKLDRYLNSEKSLIYELRESGARVILLTPVCVDPDLNPAIFFLNDTLKKFAEGIQELARKEDVPIYDIHTLMLEVQTKGKAENKNFTMSDSVHPTNPGQAVMAYGLLKAMGAKDQPSVLRIDATREEAVTDRCTVKDLKVTKGSVSFLRTDEALPTYFDPDCAAVFKYVPIMEDLNNYRFQVTGLAPGTWKLMVQGMEVGSFSSDALAGGINLAASPGPWQKIGEEVNRLSAEQENAYFVKWREVAPALVPDKEQPELDSQLARIDTLIAKQETARIQAVTKDRTWSWSLVLAK